MDRLGAGDLAGGDDGGHVTIRLVSGRRTDTDAFIGQAHMHGVAVGGGMNRHRRDAHFLACADDAQGDFAAIGDEDFLDHQPMTQRVWPNSTGSLSETQILVTVPLRGAVIGFMVFIASMMNSVSPSFTGLPTAMKVGLLGSAAR